MVLKKVGLVSVALMAAACSGGSGESVTQIDPDTVGMPPPTTTANNAPVVRTSQVRGPIGADISATIAVADAEGDTTTQTLISGPDWLSLSPNGLLSGTPSTEDIGTFELVIDVSDGVDTTRAIINVTVFMDPIEQAMSTGDYTFIDDYSDTDAPTVLLEEIAAIRARNRSAITDIFQLNADGTANEDSLIDLNWTPSAGFTSHFSPKYPNNTPLFKANDTFNSYFDSITHYYALIGGLGNARYAAFGAKPIPNVYDEDNDRHKVIKNTIEWLSQTDTGESLNIVLAQISEDSDANQMRNWLDGAFPDIVTYNNRGACDGDKLSNCLSDDVDLMVIFQDTNSESQSITVRDQIESAMHNSVALFYVDKYSENSSLGKQIDDLLGGLNPKITYPFQKQMINFSPIDTVLGWEPNFVADTEALVSGIETGTFNYDLSVCSGVSECLENEMYNLEIAAPLAQLPLLVRDIDFKKIDPFDPYNQNRFLAALLLTGDYYRGLTTFPMPKATTPSADIIRSIFADNVAVISRKFNLAMPDMGTYSRTGFDDWLLGDEAVTVISGAPFKTSGVYALPGQTVTVTRNDNNDVNTGIRVQSLNDASGQPFRTIEGTEYTRPSKITSNLIPLKPGETIEVTSAYGGPIHVGFNKPGTPVELTFSNVGTHPVWRGAEDTEKFLIDLAADDFDWAEFVTPHFEVHSTADKMRETLKNFSEPNGLADAIDTHLRDWPQWLNGQNGEGIRENTDLIAFHEQFGLSPRNPIKTVQHVIVEQPSCDESCGGNPYDTFSPLAPTTYEGVRELGQELSHDLLILRGGTEGTISDLFASHARYREFLETGQPVNDCRPLPFEETYNLLQAAHASGDPERYMTEADFGDPDRQAVFYIQLMTALQQQGVFENGWEYLPRLNVHARLVARNYGTASAWNSVRRAVGYNSTVFTTFNRLSNREKASRMLGWVAQRNVTDFLRMWGYSGTTNVNHPELRPVYYAIEPTGHCTGLDHPELPIDGTTQWP